MDAVTYPDARVEKFLNEEVVAFRPELHQETALAEGYSMLWTPGLVWLDDTAVARHSTVGWFPPEQFLAESLLGCAHVELWDDAGKARQKFERIVNEFAGTRAAPAAMYWAGVAAMKASGSSDDLLRWWKRLRQEHAESSWAMKVAFIEQPAAKKAAASGA